MQQNTGYGELEPAPEFIGTGWCPDHDICMEWIERRAQYLFENFQDVDSVYMSEDIYIQFVKTAANTRVYMGPQANSLSGLHISAIMTSAGPLTIKRIPHLVNFCHVGTNCTYDELVRIKIDKDFENIVLKDCERDE